MEVVEVGGGNVDVIEARDGRADSDLHSDSDSFSIPARPDTQPLNEFVVSLTGRKVAATLLLYQMPKPKIKSNPNQINHIK